MTKTTKTDDTTPALDAPAPKRKRKYQRSAKGLTANHLRGDLFLHCRAYLREVPLAQREPAMVRAINDVISAHAREWDTAQRSSAQAKHDAGALPFDNTQRQPDAIDALDRPNTFGTSGTY